MKYLTPLRNIKLHLKRTFYLSAVVLLTLIGQPITVSAEDAPIAATESLASPEATSSASSEPAQTGPTSPTGDASHTYTLNSETGLWENDQYTWDPATQQTTPKTTPTYSYNPATGMWDTTEWRYDAPSGSYVENPVSTPTAPLGSESNLESPSASSSLAPTYSGSGEDTLPTKAKGIFDLFYNAAISNHTSVNSSTGDATVSGNTLGGSATSGNALSIANLINLLQSSWDFMAQGGLDTFVANLFGDVHGDITLDPGAASTSSLPVADIEINSSTSSAINNDVQVGASSGNAAVTTNTEAGDATSGDATAMANLVNAINSSISAGQSFFGIVNIFGDFDGDILFSTPLGSLLSGSPSNQVSPTTAVNNNSSQTIDNNVTANATTGDATVTKNTSAGSATSGDSQSTITLLNLTGRQIVGQNALLVFVNVFGTWVGLIVDAPAGTNAAAIGNASNSGIVGASASLDSNDNQTITNNLQLSADTGDATVSNNTTAGNAKSGNATTAANIVNISSSTLSLTDWFGILFINVFGNWHGSFGVDTEAGNQVAAETAPVAATEQVYHARSSSPTASAPLDAALSAITNYGYQSVVSSSEENTSDTSQITQSESKNQSPKVLSQKQQSAVSIPQDPNLLPIIGAAVGLSMLAVDRATSLRNKRH